MVTTRIREAREQAGLTQQELADKSGVSRVTINLIENGRSATVKLSTLLGIANALGVDLSSLFLD